MLTLFIRRKKYEDVSPREALQLVKQHFDSPNGASMNEVIIYHNHKMEDQRSLEVFIGKEGGLLIFESRSPNDMEVAIDKSRTGYCVDFDSAGEPWQMEAKFFIPEESAYKGILYFLEHQERDPELKWGRGFERRSDF